MGRTIQFNPELPRRSSPLRVQNHDQTDNKSQSVKTWIKPCSVIFTDEGKDRLRDEIWGAINDSRDTKCAPGFAPIDQLRLVLSRENIQEALKEQKEDTYAPLGSSQIQTFFELLFGNEHALEKSNGRRTEPGTQSQYQTGLYKILAILLLISLPEAIIDFINEGLSDDDLPFDVDSSKPGRFLLQPKPKDSETSSRRAIRFMKASQRRSFYEQQWAIVVPVFHLDESGGIKGYLFHEKTILPFITEQACFRGAHGEILKVEIHTEHHNFETVDDAEDYYSESDADETTFINHLRAISYVPKYFAIKRISTNTEFTQEVRILKRLKHPHVINLFATYEYAGNFHLILPWAERNLAAYWEKEKPKPKKNLTTLLWMAKQCEGIAQGLAKLHRHATSTTSSIFNRTTNPAVAHAPHQAYGYGHHGDIKPMNLLWFPDSSSPPRNMGTIKISDFGEGGFSSTESSSHSTNSIGCTPSYRPPECDREEEQIEISDTYDTWTLGCLFLEFITWFIGGWKLLHEFEKLRNGPFFARNKEGVFYIKPAVISYFETLGQKAVEECSGDELAKFLTGFLKLVRTHMLVIENRGTNSEGHSRYGSNQIARGLSKLAEEFEEGIRRRSLVTKVLRQLRENVSRSKNHGDAG
ncbi:kinase-like domain-containing protein [Podospora fimiseda]|uniref:Kinase-like domain-containing protein n=1 Tax=Podospora fimiseda TaxID=252190 RepID=A0AAN7H6E6_9PEZI|nr:kinase-like domain-containing protein [Podospora fimiseda]